MQTNLKKYSSYLYNNNVLFVTFRSTPRVRIK